jgi:hypothetical protein
MSESVSKARRHWVRTLKTSTVVVDVISRSIKVSIADELSAWRILGQAQQLHIVTYVTSHLARVCSTEDPCCRESSR